MTRLITVAIVLVVALYVGTELIDSASDMMHSLMNSRNVNLLSVR